MKVINLGLIHYQEAYDIQKMLNKEIYQGNEEETILICSHPPIVSLGKKGNLSDLIGWQGEVIEIERGGQATYHGPSQVIAYPIINVSHRGNDIYLYLRQLEYAISKTLSEYGLATSGDPENTGVWLDNKKIASIGIAIKRWVTYHGLAINIYHDPAAFRGISPCGMSYDIMTNLETILEEKIERNEFEKYLSLHLANALSKNKFPICQAEGSI